MGKMRFQLKNATSDAALSDELSAIKVALGLIVSKLPRSAAPEHICDSLRDMNTVKGDELADFLASCIQASREQ